MDSDEIIVEIENKQPRLDPENSDTFEAFKSVMLNYTLSPIKEIHGDPASYVSGYSLEIDFAKAISEMANKISTTTLREKFYKDYVAFKAAALRDVDVAADKVAFDKNFSSLVQRLQLFVLATNETAPDTLRNTIIQNSTLAVTEEFKAYRFSSRVCVFAKDEHIELYKQALSDLVSLAKLMKGEFKTSFSKRTLKGLNITSAVLQEIFTLGTLWTDVITNHIRLDAEYDYERVRRTLARKDDATGDVAQIEQIVNSFITSGVKNTENQPVKVEVQPCPPCPETEEEQQTT